jgi:hypothetical protein
MMTDADHVAAAVAVLPLLMIGVVSQCTAGGGDGASAVRRLVVTVE